MTIDSQIDCTVESLKQIVSQPYPLRSLSIQFKTWNWFRVYMTMVTNMKEYPGPPLRENIEKELPTSIRDH